MFTTCQLVQDFAGPEKPYPWDANGQAVLSWCVMGSTMDWGMPSLEFKSYLISYIAIYIIYII